MLVIDTKFCFFLLLRGLETPFQQAKPHFGILRKGPNNDPRKKIDQEIPFLWTWPCMPHLLRSISPKMEASLKIGFDYLLELLLGFQNWCDTYMFVWKGDLQLLFKDMLIFTDFWLSGKMSQFKGVLDLSRWFQGS